MKLLSISALGVFLGANITEGCLLVPYWRSLAPADFFAWYAANDRRLLGFFGPLTTITALIVLATAAIAVWTRAAGRWPMAIAAGLMVVATATSAPSARRAPVAISAAVSSLTAPWASRVAALTPSRSRFALLEYAITPPNT